MILDKGALAIRHAAADPEERPGVLTCVLVEPHPSGTGHRLVATDGHMMASIDVGEQRDLFTEGEQFPLPESWTDIQIALLPAAMFEQVERALPKIENPKVAVVRDDADGEVVCVGPDGKEAGRATTKGKQPSVAGFPKHYSLLNLAEQTPVFKFTLDFALIARMAKIAKACGAMDKNGRLSLTFCYVGGKDAPVVVLPGGAPRVVGLVMPMSPDAGRDVVEPETEDDRKDAFSAILEGFEATVPAAPKTPLGDSERLTEENVREVVREVADRINAGELDTPDMKVSATVTGSAQATQDEERKE